MLLRQFGSSIAPRSSYPIGRDGRVGLLFLIPGVGVTLRVNGTAELHAERELLASYAVGDKVPATVIRITVSSVYTQCPKALIRSELWNPERFRDSADLPTVGQIMQTITNGEFDGAAWDAGYPKLIQETIY
jgi:predicted pyridoxine 5'-phosphate oxidase superfamily flavin-nucleotide-binding protein